MGLRSTEIQPFRYAFGSAYSLLTVREGHRLGPFLLLSRTCAFALEWRLCLDISRGLVAQSAFIYGHVRKFEVRGEALFFRGEEIQGPDHGAGPVFIHWFHLPASPNIRSLHYGIRHM